MTRVRTALLALSVWAASLSAQTQTSAAPSFDVASIRPNTSGASTQSSRTGKGFLTMTNMRPRAIIVSAYGVRPERIIGVPEWFDRERFDISARAPADTPDNQLPLMLRTLLTERFRLVVHTETREQPVYALVMARADRGLGPGLTPATECEETAGGSASAPPASATASGKRSCTVFTGSNGREASVTGGARAIDALVRALQNLQGVIDRPVVDRTGLTGTYDFEVRFSAAAMAATSADDSLPSIFTALQEQLGLRLEASRGPVEVLVIDAVDRPTPN